MKESALLIVLRKEAIETKEDFDLFVESIDVLHEHMEFVEENSLSLMNRLILKEEDYDYNQEVLELLEKADEKVLLNSLLTCISEAHSRTYFSNLDLIFRCLFYDDISMASFVSWIHENPQDGKSRSNLIHFFKGRLYDVEEDAANERNSEKRMKYLSCSDSISAVLKVLRT